MKTQRSNQNLKKAFKEAENQEAPTNQVALVAGTPEINSW